MEFEPTARHKFYYLYRSACKPVKDADGFISSMTVFKGIPAVTVCIMKNENGTFYRGISIASESEKSVMKNVGRNKAYGRMIKAFSRNDRGPSIKDGGAMRQIMKVMDEGPRVDNPAKYVPKVLRSYWESCADTSKFERRLFNDEA